MYGVIKNFLGIMENDYMNKSNSTVPPKKGGTVPTRR